MNLYTHTFEPLLVFTLTQALVELSLLLTWDFDFLHNLCGFVVDFYVDCDWIPMIIHLKNKGIFILNILGIISITNYFNLDKNKNSLYILMYLFFKAGLQVNCFVSHLQLFRYMNLETGFLVNWRKLYFPNHQTASIPRDRKRCTQRVRELFMSLFFYKL